MKKTNGPMLGLNPKLKELLTNGKHLEIFTHGHGRILQKVDFKNQVLPGFSDMGKYKIKLSPEINKNAEIACVLPNHPEPDKQVMFVHDYWSLDKFNKELNLRLKDSHSISDGVGTAQLAVCYGGHAYLCKGVTGTVYVVWSTHISVTNKSNVAATMSKGSPLIINKDGKQVYKGIYIMPLVVQDALGQLSRIPFGNGSPNIVFPTNSNIFVSETRTLTHRTQPKIKTMSASEAMIFMITQDDSIQKSVSCESNPWQASLDFEEEGYGMELVNSFNYGSGPDNGTPRQEDIFLQELPTDPRRLQNTPPVLISDPETPDPFFEEEEKSKFIPVKKEII